MSSIRENRHFLFLMDHVAKICLRLYAIFLFTPQDIFKICYDCKMFICTVMIWLQEVYLYRTTIQGQR